MSSENCPSRICPNVNPRENEQKFGIQSVRQFADNLLDQITGSEMQISDRKTTFSS